MNINEDGEPVLSAAQTQFFRISIFMNNVGFSYFWRERRAEADSNRERGWNPLWLSGISLQKLWSVDTFL